MRILISVRDLAEARLAAQAGANLIDLKEPRAGALGGLPSEQIRTIVRTLRAEQVSQPISATIGDWPMRDVEPVLQRALEVGACGVDFVKVGLWPRPDAMPLAQSLAQSGLPLVFVLLADEGVDGAFVGALVQLPVRGVMLDTAHKTAGTLTDCLSATDLSRFVQQVQRRQLLAGLAGSLRADHIAPLRRHRPDYLGFRAAVCDGDRTQVLSLAKAQALCRACHSPPVA